ncbi:hypothetical protein TNCV_2772071 [Trichonephila clavipes]|nr:hypothetical protein TNCV_2772071 [Trichonephila clavipes]
MPSPVQSNSDAHDTIANGQYGAGWSMGHTQQDEISVFCRRRTSNTTSPMPSTTHSSILNDFHSRETTLSLAEIVEVEIEVVSPSIVPSGSFAELKSHCHLYGAQGQRQAYLLPMPR